MLLPTRERILFQEHTPVPVWVVPSPILLRLHPVAARYALLSSHLAPITVRKHVPDDPPAGRAHRMPLAREHDSA